MGNQSVNQSQESVKESREIDDVLWKQIVMNKRLRT